MADIYRRGAPVYRAADWLGVLLLPVNEKSLPPAGYTGWLGAWPTDEQIEEWRTSRPNGNLLLRAQPGQLGLDFDAYNSKTGGLTLKEGESRWGPLPPTWRSSARPDDPVSGIRLYRVPDDYRSVGVLNFPRATDRRRGTDPAPPPRRRVLAVGQPEDREGLSVVRPRRDAAARGGGAASEGPARADPAVARRAGDDSRQPPMDHPQGAEARRPGAAGLRRGHRADRRAALAEGVGADDRGALRRAVGAVPARHHARPRHGVAALRKQRSAGRGVRDARTPRGLCRSRREGPPAWRGRGDARVRAVHHRRRPPARRRPQRRYG